MSNIVAARPASGAPVESSWGGEVHDQVEGLGRGGRYWGTTAVTLTTSAQKLDLNTTVAGGDATFLDAANDRLVIPAGAAGLYCVVTIVRTPTTLPAGAVVNLSIRRNGTDAPELGAGVTAEHTNSAAEIVRVGFGMFAVGDQLEVWMHGGSSGGTALINSVHLVRIAPAYV